MKHTQEEATHKSKHGIDITVYDTDTDAIGFVCVETEKGHFQEFSDSESMFMYYVLEGEGVFFLNGAETAVKAGDLLVIPPKTNIYYVGKLKMTLTTVPGWKAENEVHVRYIDEK